MLFRSVFLKTNFRKVFFLVSETAEELSVLDALKYFKAPILEFNGSEMNVHEIIDRMESVGYITPNAVSYTHLGLQAAKERGKLTGRPIGLSEDAKRKAIAAKRKYLYKVALLPMCNILHISPIE